MNPAGATPVHERVALQQLACHRLHWPGGDAVCVAEHGAQVLSWMAGGSERLYLSPRAVLDGSAAIRGGIPVCWPQFSDRGPLPRHGWVRQVPWRFARAELGVAEASLRFEIDPAACRPAGVDWPHRCRLALTVTLSPGCLTVSLAIHNQGPTVLPFTGALHTYLALDDAHRASVSGWPDGGRGWDTVRDVPCPVLPALPLQGEIDRILPTAPEGLRVDDGPKRLVVTQAGWSDTVVWNPGPDKAAAMADLPPGDERRLACVEAAQALSVAEVAPGATWVGRQRLVLA